MFELGARPHPPRELYRSYLAQSDVFVGIYGESYGWVAPDEEVSGLEDEYNLAPASMPKLIYIKASDHRDERLNELIDRIRSDDTAAYLPFDTADELEEQRRRRPRHPARRALRRAARRADGARRPARGTRRHGCPSRTPRRSAARRTSRAVRELLASGARPGRQPDRPRRHRQEPARHRDRPRPASDLFPDGTVLRARSRACSSRGCCCRRSPTPSASATTATPPLEERIARALAGRRVLIVLDNFEQIVDAAPVLVRLYSAGAAGDLPRDEPIVLRIRGERVYEVAAAADSRRATRPRRSTARCARPAVRAVRRPRAGGQAGLRRSPRTTSADVADICRRLEGLPLAIELAAAQGARCCTPRGHRASASSRACRC